MDFVYSKYPCVFVRANFEILGVPITVQLVLELACYIFWIFVLDKGCFSRQVRHFSGMWISYQSIPTTSFALYSRAGMDLRAHSNCPVAMSPYCESQLLWLSIAILSRCSPASIAVVCWLSSPFRGVIEFAVSMLRGEERIAEGLFECLWIEGEGFCWLEIALASMLLKWRLGSAMSTNNNKYSVLSNLWPLYDLAEDESVKERETWWGACIIVWLLDDRNWRSLFTFKNCDIWKHPPLA